MIMYTANGYKPLQIPAGKMAYGLHSNHLRLELSNLDNLHIRLVKDVLYFDFGDAGNPFCSLSRNNVVKTLDLYVTPSHIRIISFRHDLVLGPIRDTFSNRQTLVDLPKMFEQALGDLLCIKVNSVMVA